MKKNIFYRIATFLSIASILFQTSIPLLSVLSPVVFAQEVTPTETVVPVIEPTATPTVTPILDLAAEPTVIPAVETTVMPTLEPTATPTAEPTVIPTVEPTTIPTVTTTPTSEPTTTPTVNTSPKGEILDGISTQFTPTTTATPTIAEPTIIETPEIVGNSYTDPSVPTVWKTLYSQSIVEKVELNKEYIAPQNSGVKLTFTKLPTNAGNIKIEEITLTKEQIEKTGSLTNKAYDITSDMANGSFTYNLSLPIPEASKGKTVEVKFAEELSGIGSAAKVENTLSKTDTSVSVTSLDHFTIFVVTSLNTQDGCNAVLSGTTLGTTCFSTIQAAINAANPAGGDTINVAVGGYNESLNITNPVILQSVGGRDVTNIRSLTIATSNVTVSGFTIEGVNAGGVASANVFLRSGISNITVSNNKIINVGSGDDNVNGDSGVGLLTTSDLVHIGDNLNVMGNIFQALVTGSNRAFYINPGINHFTFSGNAITGNFAYTATTQAKSGLVENNTITGAGAVGSRSAGFRALGEPDPTVWGHTTFSGNTVSGVARGITVDEANNVTITGNTLSGNGIGIRVVAYSSLSFDITTISVYKNNLSNEDTFGVTNNEIATTTKVDASSNWWGAISGPGIVGSGTGDKVSTNVGYKPWCTNLACTTFSSDNPTTTVATVVTSTTATLNGIVGTSNTDNTSFWYGTTSAGPFTSAVNPSSQVQAGWFTPPVTGTQSAGASFSDPLTGLTPGTPYYFVAWSLVDGTWYPGAVLSFNTADKYTQADFKAFDGVGNTNLGINQANGYTESSGITATYTGSNTIKLTGYAPIVTPWFGIDKGWTTYNYVTIGIKLPAGFIGIPVTGGKAVSSTGVMRYDGRGDPITGYLMGAGSTPVATTGAASGYLDYSFAANSNNTKKDGLVKLQVIWNVGDAPEYFTIDVNGLQLVDPAVITSPANLITATSATINGIVGGVNADYTSFWLGTTTISNQSPSATPNLPTGWSHTDFPGTVSAGTPFSQNLIGLTPSTQYYFVAWARSINGTTWYPGAIQTFTTAHAAYTQADFVAFDGVNLGTNSYTKSTGITATYNSGTGTETDPVKLALTGYAPIVTPWFNSEWTTYNYVAIGIKLPVGFSGTSVYSADIMRYDDSTQPNGYYTVNYGSTPLATTGGAHGYLNYEFAASSNNTKKDGIAKLKVIWTQGGTPEYFTINVNGLQLAPNAPTATLTADGVSVSANGYTDSNTFTFNLSSADATRYQLKYWNDIVSSRYKEGTPWNSTTLSAAYSDSFTQGEGTHYFAFSACNAASNCSAYSTPFKVTYDKTAPTVPENGTPDNKSIAMNDFDFNWDESFDLSSITYEFQSSLDPSQSGEVLTTGLWHSGVLSNNKIHSSGAPDGTWYWQVRAIDASGNISAWSNIWNVMIDTTKPTEPIATPAAGGITSGQTITLASSDSGSGLNSIYYTIDGVTTPDKTSTLDIAPIAVDKDMTIKAIAYDNAGNASTVLSASYEVAPIISVETPTFKTLAPAVLGSSTSGGGGGSLSPASTPTCNDTKPGSAPTLISAVSNSLNSITLTWSKANGPVSYYLVTFGNKPGEQLYGNPNVGGADTTSYRINNLSGGIYYFKVRAGNGCAPGEYSNELSGSATGGFVAGVPGGFESGVLGAQTQITPTVTPITIPSNSNPANSSSMNFFQRIWSFILKLFGK